MAGFVLTAGLIALLLVWWRPTAPSPETPTEVTTCNGLAALCDRRVDQVTFPAAHNAHSNSTSPDWMFPHHRAGIPRMLRDGIRMLAIDIHYGLAGGARIKTDLRARADPAAS